MSGSGHLEKYFVSQILLFLSQEMKKFFTAAKYLTINKVSSNCGKDNSQVKLTMSLLSQALLEITT